MKALGIAVLAATLGLFALAPAQASEPPCEQVVDHGEGSGAAAPPLPPPRNEAATPPASEERRKRVQEAEKRDPPRRPAGGAVSPDAMLIGLPRTL